MSNDGGDRGAIIGTADQCDPAQSLVVYLVGYVGEMLGGLTFGLPPRGFFYSDPAYTES